MKMFLLKDTTGRGIHAIKLGEESILDFVDESDEQTKQDVSSYLECAEVGDSLHLEDERALIIRIQDK